VILASAAEFPIYEACLAAVFVLKMLLEDPVKDSIQGFLPTKICQALGYGNPGNIYEIAVVDTEIYPSTIFVTTVTGVNPPDVITSVQIDYLVSGCTMKTAMKPTSTQTESSFPAETSLKPASTQPE
jgi:hypothetical protein